MTDQSRVVKNQLFNVSVTGATFEDFSQNAVILPAPEPPPPPSPPQQVFIETNNAEYANSQNPVDAFVGEVDFQQEPQQDNQPAESTTQLANLNAVFSSFSNIFKPQQSAVQQQEIVAPPAGIGNIINQESDTNHPVPLYASSVQVTPQAPPPVPQGRSNSYRLGGLKRPVYAKVPGLTTCLPPQSVATNQQPSTVLSQQSPYQTDAVEAKNSISENYFKPVHIIQPQSSVSDGYSASSSLNCYNPNFTTISAPVLTAIPKQSAIMTMANSDHAHSCDQTNENILPMTQNETNQTSQIYRPVYHHWFHKNEIEGRVIWHPFSMVDSLALEEAFTSNDLSPEKVVATDGGRFDVNILRRQRIAVYWKSSATEVRRCSWFYKRNDDGRYVPYEENIATMLEEQYKIAYESNVWHRSVELPNGETVVFHGHDVLVLFPQSQSPDNWGNTPQNQTRPRVVKRGMDEFDIDEGEPTKVDHLLFLVHGIGSVCDLKFRTVEEVVHEFRSISLQLVRSHYRSSCEAGSANRIEVLPISWHEKLHSEDTGIDRKLESITLESIPRLRNFTNDTLLDILFYTSPFYCQTIISHVGGEMNRIYDLFKQRNPTFNGEVSLGGHSLGSLILFDLLCHQHNESEKDDEEEDDEIRESDDGEDVVPPLKNSKPPPSQRRMSRRISYMMGRVGTGQPELHYPHLNFQPIAFFALGSPIGMFVTVRGLDNLGEQFALPTCRSFFNIFHPYDPVAYRIESLVNPQLSSLKPVLIPHHKGRKRMHLELKETMARVGADLKQKIIDSMKSTWNSVYQLAMFKSAPNQSSFEEEVSKALEEQLGKNPAVERIEETEEPQTDLSLGILNGGCRIDYVLQEAPLEFFNEYIFALTSHVCYWESEDTMLLILKEIYNSMGVSSDSQVPQQTMTIERPPPSPKSSREGDFGVDPTMPQKCNNNLGPPPTSGFVRKT